MLSSLLQLLLWPALLRASAVLPVDFYPVVDDQYLAAGPVAAPAAPLPVVLPSGYSGDQFYNNYEDTGARSGGGRYNAGDQNAGYYNEKADKGNSGREAVAAYDHGLRSQHKKQNDQGYYGDLSALRKAFDDRRAYQGGQKYGQQARNSQVVGNKGGHKKGHTTTGFTNSYHKDETGKKSEFYDSSNDEGDTFAYKGQDEAYGGQAGNAFQGGHQDNLYKTDSRGKEGHYGGGVNLADTKGHKNDYGRQEYYDQQRDFGNKRAQQNGKQLGGYYDAGGRHGAGGGSSAYYGGHDGHGIHGVHAVHGGHGGATGAGTLGFHSAAPYPYY